MAGFVSVAAYFLFEVLQYINCQDDHPPAYIASAWNRPVQLEPLMSENHYNFFDNMVLGLGWFIPVMTVVLLGVCLLSVCGILERSLTKKPEARLYYAAPGGVAAFQPAQASMTKGSFGGYDPDDSIAKQPYGYSVPEPDHEHGYNDPAPEYAEGGYRATSPEGFSDTSSGPLYKPDNV